MKNSTRFSVAALIAFLIVFGLLINGAYRRNLTYTEAFVMMLCSIMIMILESRSKIMAVRETMVCDAISEVELICVAKGSTVEVTRTQVLPPVPWYLGGRRLIKGTDVVDAVVTCMWFDQDKKTSSLARVIRTRDDRLPVTPGPDNKAFIQVPAWS